MAQINTATLSFILRCIDIFELHDNKNIIDFITVVTDHCMISQIFFKVDQL